MRLWRSSANPALQLTHAVGRHNNCNTQITEHKSKVERFHPLLTAIILGTIHAAWHLPMLSYYGTTFGWFLFNAIPMTIIFNWFCLKSRKSVIPVMLLHAGTNAIGNYIPIPMVVLGGFGTEMFLRGSVYWVMAIVIVILTKGRLGCETTDTSLAV